MWIRTRGTDCTLPPTMFGTARKSTASHASPWNIANLVRCVHAMPYRARGHSSHGQASDNGRTPCRAGATAAHPYFQLARRQSYPYVDVCGV